MGIKNKIIQTCLLLALTTFAAGTVIKGKLNNHEAAPENRLNSIPKYDEKLEKLQAQDETVNYRLPSTMKPKHYDLYLHPNLQTGTFSGQETIQINVLTATTQIILHSHNLTINHVYVTGPFGENLEVANYSFETEPQFLIINMVKTLTGNTNIKLGIIFEGTLRDKIVGLYSSTYLTPEMDIRPISTTQFEPTYARQAFPCFDEPAMKAIFDITLVHPSGDNYHALSNMENKSSLFLGEYTETRFAETVPMSSYLAVFIVSDFAHKMKPVNTNGIGTDFNVRIFATPHKVNNVEFALDTAVAVIEYYIQYFKVAYPLPKLDMAAIPDFSSNAMENWGLVTYRESGLLYDKSFSSAHNKQRIAAVIAHELVHMWFGNLVTMKWWNDLWLNEGFARGLQYKGVHAVYPTWGMLDIFNIETMHPVMVFDASTASHPIVQTVETPDQISQMFDTISYDKGAAIIRMLEDVISAQKFEQAVTNYLNTFKYDNAVTDDFLTELAKTGVDFDIKLMMRTWTEQMGYPVVEVKRIDGRTFNITQKRFFSNPEDYNLEFDGAPFNYKWSIPLTYKVDTQSNYERLWLNYDEHHTQLQLPANVNWIKLNEDQVGYYRVNYDQNNWVALIDNLVRQPKELFSTADRAQLLNDAFALADAGQLDYDIALNMTVYLENETEFVPWYVAATKLQDLQRKLTVTEYQVDFLKYARALIQNVYNQVTWTVDEDNHLKNRLRVSVLTAACSLGLPDCLNEAALRFNAWLLEPSQKPDPDLREIVYYYGMQRVNTKEAWDQMWQLFVAEQDASEKLKLMYGLSGVRMPWLLHRFAELAGNVQYVRGQDYYTCLQYIASNPVGEPIIWDFVREEWPAMVERFGLYDRYMGRMIPTITANFASETKLDEMQAFFNKYPEAGAGAVSRQQALQTLKYNIKWLEENKDKVGVWLKNHLQS